MKEAKDYILRFHWKWSSIIWLQLFLIAVAVAVSVFVFSNSLLWSFTAMLFSLLIQYFVTRSKFPSHNDLIKLVDQSLENSEYSTALLFDTNLSSISALQGRKVAKSILKEQRRIALPINWRPVMVVFALCILLSAFGLISNEEITLNRKENQAEPQLSSSTKNEEILEIETSIVTITPPKYTQINAYKSKDLNLDIPQGSEIKWRINFTQEPDLTTLNFSSGEKIPLGIDILGASNSLRNPKQGFYWITYKKGNQTGSTDYFKILVNEDQPPSIDIKGIPSYQKIPFDEAKSVEFKVDVQDDYGLSDAYVIATITKGSGESVKFREQKLQFDNKVSGKSVNLKMSLDPKFFEMEPGNELYFYVAAIDNRAPNPHLSRSETYFFILEDTAEVEFSLEGSLGVDLMPEYFRSQRQIIIDTEKLITKRKEISKATFNHESNELGFDQKTLRLKYGQFLGVEDESGIAIENDVEFHEEDEEMHEEDILEEYGHNHDHEEEEGQLLDKGTEQEDVVSKFGHSHDNMEEATFFHQSLKTKLKAALSEMWDSELHLRLFNPEKSLPYQYRALKLLKEIKNHARIYVQRVGFDPPPLKESEKRLQGKLEEVSSGTFRENQENIQEYPAIRAVIPKIEALDANRNMSNTLKAELQEAGNELAGLAIESPTKYLNNLAILKKLIDKDQFDKMDIESLKQINRVFIKLLPTSDNTPGNNAISNHELNQRFIEQLRKIEPNP